LPAVPTDLRRIAASMSYGDSCSVVRRMAARRPCRVSSTVSRVGLQEQRQGSTEVQKGKTKRQAR
jgi:hypothetical protein